MTCPVERSSKSLVDYLNLDKGAISKIAIDSVHYPMRDLLILSAVTTFLRGGRRLCNYNIRVCAKRAAWTSSIYEGARGLVSGLTA